MCTVESESSNLVARVPPVNPRVPSVPLAIKFFLTGVVFPISCLIHSCCGLTANVDQPWQSGNPSVYIGLLLACPSILAFLPLMLFSMACITIWAFHPTSRRYALIRCGNYLGLGLCIQVFGMIVMLTGPITLIAAIIVGPTVTTVVQSLKCGCPVFHRFIRLRYDFVGPPLARAFAIHPLLADVAYLLLMPIEFAAELLRLTLRFPSIKIDSLYKVYKP